MPVVDRALVDQTVERLRAGVHRRWEPFPDARAFLADYRPQVWAEVRGCRLETFHTSEKVDDPDQVKVWARRCGLDPWCLECTHYRHWRRVRRVFDRWSKCTPAGHEPRFSHVVITAPIYFAACAVCDPRAAAHDGGPDPECGACHGGGFGKPHPASWGMAASRNVRLFMEVVWRVLSEIYGEGLGAHMSYQDHGEAGLARRHPHIDLTLNGYVIKDGRVDDLPRFDLTGGGRQHFVEVIEKHANALHLGARATSLYVGSVLEGFARYQKILGYQVRELIDLRKLRYDRTRQMVGWESYKEPYEITWLSVREWWSAFEEYCARLRVFNGVSGRKLHYDYGHMAANRIRATQAVTGGKPEPHAEGCSCSRCGDWRRVFIQGGALDEWHALASPYDA